MKSIFIKFLALLLATFLVTACSSGNSGSAPSESDGDSAENVEEIDFPKRDIEIVVPYAAGGTTDTSARALSSVISDYMPNGVNVNVVNKPGGGAIIGTMEIVNAKPDGYKIGMTTSGPMTIKPHTDNPGYNPDSFKQIMQVVATPNVLLVKEDAPWQTYEEWFEYVSNNPGEFTYATTGAGLTQHITMEAFSLETGVELTHMPFDGGAPSIAALLGDHVMGAVVQTVEAIPHVEAGSVRALVNTGTLKTEGFEDVPLLTELGIDVGFDVWTGLIANGDTPDEIVEILHDAFSQALEDERVVETFEKLGVSPSYAGPTDFYEIMNRNYNTTGEVLKTIGMAE
ncbi:tripartite tricarboxylate transporter substrate binding protein [Alkalihalobacillus sp. BA299]|uniref:Bug family tripartite tricarboxylate transporter substrate binding protein n=1 Tax=Alkalihalobacillus sp. BA299 TaxID=2815938 RepID=UPI001ADC3744|nr:tripartite tricarboxylate transporter substrate binding protein [Alkalihalobacillus sp. BA299]